MSRRILITEVKKAQGVNSPPSTLFLVAVFASGLIIYDIAKVYDDQGRPVVGASVSYRQATSDFLFGMPPQAPDDSTWLLLKEAGVNYVEMFMSWKLTDDAGFRIRVDYTFTPPSLKRYGIVLLSGHCLVWMVASYPENPSADPMNLPARVMPLKYDELKKEL